MRTTHLLLLFFLSQTSPLIISHADELRGPAAITQDPSTLLRFGLPEKDIDKLHGEKTPVQDKNLLRIRLENGNDLMVYLQPGKNTLQKAVMFYKNPKPVAQLLPESAQYVNVRDNSMDPTKKSYRLIGIAETGQIWRVELDGAVSQFEIRKPWKPEGTTGSLSQVLASPPLELSDMKFTKIQRNRSPKPPVKIIQEGKTK